MINIQDPQVKQVAPGLVYAILFKTYDDFTAIKNLQGFVVRRNQERL